MGLCLCPSTCSRRSGVPLADHASPAPAVAGEAVSAVNEREAGGGAEGEEHVEGGRREEGAHAEAAYAEAGEIAVAAHSGQAAAASVADELLPEETATSAGASISGSIQSHDKDHESEDAAAGGEGEDLGEGKEVGAEGEEEHPGGGTDGEPCTAMTCATVAGPLSPPPLAPQGAPLKPRIIPPPLAPAFGAPEFLHC